MRVKERKRMFPVPNGRKPRVRHGSSVIRLVIVDNLSAKAEVGVTQSS